MTDDPMSKPDPMSELVPFTARGARRCRARNRSKVQCGRAAIDGGTVCDMHGGAAPQVRRKAELRLIELVDPAIGVLGKEMKTAEKSADRIKAANSVLDRAGVPRKTEMTIEDAREYVIAELLKMQGEVDE